MELTSSLKAITLVALLGSSFAEDSKTNNVQFVNSDNNRIGLDYFTSMSEDGTLTLNLEGVITNVPR